jgi:ribosomal protein S9
VDFVRTGLERGVVRMVLVHMEVLRGEIDHMEVRLREVGRTEVAPRRMSVEDLDHMAIVQEADHTIQVVESVESVGADVRTEIEGVVGQMSHAVEVVVVRWLIWWLAE